MTTMDFCPPLITRLFPRAGLWDQPGGLCQLHHERHHPVGRRGVLRAEGRGAPGAADKEQRLHAAGVGAARRSDPVEQSRRRHVSASEARRLFYCKQLIGD